MSEQHLKFEAHDNGVAVLTLNRPERLNAINGPLLEELRAAVSKIDADPSIHVYIITGAARKDGRPCFSAGADARAFEEGEGPEEAKGFALTNAIDDSLTPSIAVVDGVCTTGAAELALACDFRLVARSAQISDWHLKKIGIGTGGWGASTRWARLVGTTKAKEIILTGKVFDGDEAVRIGFASAVHPSERLMEEALAFAANITEMNPKGVRATLAHLNRIEDMSRDQALNWATLVGQWLGAAPNTDEFEDAILSKPKQ